MDSIISTFHIDWKIIIAQALNFIIVFVVLYIFALKPLSKLMVERAEKIKKGLFDSKKANELLQKAGEEYKENTIKLRKVSADAQKELSKDLEKLRAENLERIKKDNEEWTKKRAVQMEIDKKALVESAKKEVIDVAMLAVEKIMSGKKDLNNL
jgi:F-type H+-transporting ATPase subunit b